MRFKFVTVDIDLPNDKYHALRERTLDVENKNEKGPQELLCGSVSALLVTSSTPAGYASSDHVIRVCVLLNNCSFEDNSVHTSLTVLPIRSMSSFRIVRPMRISALVRTRQVPPPDFWTGSSNFPRQINWSPNLRRYLHGSQSAYVDYANLYVNK
jgi:hypothetical protein